MDRFATNLKRKFKKAYQPKSRISRPAKLRLIQRDVEEDLSASPELSAGPEIIPRSADATSLEQDGTNLDSQAESTAVPNQSFSGAGSETSVEAQDVETKFEEQDAGAVETTTLTTEETHSVGQAQPLSEHTAVDLAVDEAAAIREQYYILFAESGDEEGDYTEGPPRMILTSDGIKTCGALLMTLPLSSKIKNSITALREFNIAKRTADNADDVYRRFGYVLEDEINSHKDRISKESTDDEAQKRRLEDELRNLELMLEANRMEQLRLQEGLKYQSKVLRQHQQEVNAELEAAFIVAKLLEPETNPGDVVMEELDLQTEYQKFIADEGSVVGGTPVTATPLDTSRDHMYAKPQSLTPEQQREADLKEAAYEAFWRLHAAREAFDRREMDRTAERAANAEAAALGQPTLDASPEAFDLRWVQKIQELTRELIEAENALSAAKAAAMEAGIDVPVDDRASGFVDDVADGYRMSLEQAMIGSVPSPTIKDWVNGIPEVASPSFNEHANEADEWEAEDVEISDSVSMVAQDAGERRRIDKWRQVCGL